MRNITHPKKGRGRIGVFFTQDFPADRQGPLEVGSRFGQIAQPDFQRAQIVERLGRVGIFLAEHFDADRQRLFLKR